MPFNEVLAAATLVTNIAKRLKQDIIDEGKIPESGQPSENELAKGIQQLIEEGFLVLNKIDIETPETLKESLLNRVTNAITDFQSKFSNLTLDGILANQTLNFLNQALCPGSLDRKNNETIGSTATSVEPKIGSKKRPKLRYFIESLPNIPENTQIIKEAWGAWSRRINLDIQRTGTKDEANVIIKTVPLDGANTLARATLGPPGATLMDVKFDSTEVWDDQKLLFAAIHEFGHTLGLDHVSTEKNIMFKRRQLDFVGIGPLDDQLVVAIWGERKA